MIWLLLSEINFFFSWPLVEKAFLKYLNNLQVKQNSELEVKNKWKEIPNWSNLAFSFAPIQLKHTHIFSFFFNLNSELWLCIILYFYFLEKLPLGDSGCSVNISIKAHLFKLYI